MKFYNKFFNTNDLSLMHMIKLQIGSRIFVCIALLITALVFVTFDDILNQLRNVEIRIERECQSLERFIITQSLINNTQASLFKIDRYNKKSNMHVKWINEELTPDKTLSWLPPFNWKYYYPIRQINANLGYFEVTGSFLNDNTFIINLIKRLILIIFFSCSVYILLRPLSKKIPYRLFIEPINKILNILEETDTKQQDSKSSAKEIREIENKIFKILQDKQDRARKDTLIELSTQVAHDIRSPLVALNCVVKYISILPEDKRLLIRQAVSRINDIANNLLFEYRNQHVEQNYNLTTPELVVILIDNIISEKRTQNENTNIEIIKNFDDSIHGSFVKVNASEFCRAISNLIDNAVESIAGPGVIVIKLIKKFNDIQLSIIDNGCGISNDLISKVISGGVTVGKKAGNGLGLSFAANRFKAWNCNFHIESKLGKGTAIEITIPEISPPPFFLCKLLLWSESTVVVLDDDESIHEVWKQRLLKYDLSTNLIKIIHFTDPNKFIEWHRSFSDLEKNIYLIDYGFIGHKMNGLDIIKLLSIANQSLLVTSRYDDDNIKISCNELKLKIIPKNYSLYIPIEILHRNPDIIYVDDDVTLTYLWENMGTVHGKKVSTFNSANDFMRVANYYDKLIPIYIDSSLGEEMKGEDFSKILNANGHQEIYLATGYHGMIKNNMPWIKEIVGKDPPFIQL